MQHDRQKPRRGQAAGAVDNFEHPKPVSEFHQPGSNSLLDYVSKYIRRGWRPVPIPTGQKGPRVRQWQRLRITEADAAEYFNGRGNVGIILGAPSGLADVDLDCAEAMRFAPNLLPETGATFGRVSKRKSHQLYQVDGPVPSLQFKDPITNDMLLELRGDSLQTVFPPSIHPSGEAIEWEVTGEPSTISYDVLKGSASRLAARCLVERYLPLVSDYAGLLKALDTADLRVAARITEWLGILKPPTANKGTAPRNLKSLSHRADRSFPFLNIPPRCPSWLHSLPGYQRLADRVIREFALHVLDHCISEIRRKKEPGRADLLFRKSIRLGVLIARGYIDPIPVADALFDACVCNRLVAKNGEVDIRRQIDRGFTYGAIKARRSSHE